MPIVFEWNLLCIANALRGKQGRHEAGQRSRPSNADAASICLQMNFPIAHETEALEHSHNNYDRNACHSDSHTYPGEIVASLGHGMRTFKMCPVGVSAYIETHMECERASRFKKGLLI